MQIWKNMENVKLAKMSHFRPNLAYMEQIGGFYQKGKLGKFIDESANMEKLWRSFSAHFRQLFAYME